VNAPSDNDSAAGGAVPPASRERRATKPDRRALTFRTLLTSGFSPRRRGGRRAGEQELLVDFHEPYLLLLSVVMLVLSVCDAFLTVKLMANGAEEANPLLAFVLNEHPGLFAITKMALTGFGVVLFVAMARAKVFKLIRAGVFFQLLVAAYLVLVVYEAWLVRSLL
jgi:hypothetical protein